MGKTDYTAIAMRKEEVPICDALEVGNHQERYAEARSKLLKRIRDPQTREKAEATLRSFGSGSDGYLAQSNPYMLVALQKTLPDSKILATRPALQTARENKSNFMSEFYVDHGLNLVTSEGAYQVNKIPAGVLANDLKKVGISLEDAKLIPYTILDLGSSKLSPNGLVFKLSKEGKDMAKDVILNTDDFKWDYSPSSPGLFSAYLGRDGNWLADVQDFDYSDEFGRVVVETTGEAGAREISSLNEEAEKLIANQIKERADLVAKLSA